MKKAIFILFLLSGLNGSSQSNSGNLLLDQFKIILKNPSIISNFEPIKNQNFKYILLPTKFGGNTLKNLTEVKKLKNAQIRCVALVYSQFKSTDSFKQKELNKKRLLELSNLYPNLFDNNEITWQYIEQSNANDFTSASELFHGFVIYYRPASSIESMKKEIYWMDKKIDKAIKLMIVPNKEFAVLDEKRDQKELKKRDTREHRIESKFSESSDGIIKSYAPFSYQNVFSDTSISSILNRNKHWTDMLIACDLTGSMSPYSTQLLVWHKLNFNKNRVQNFAFFNDGNMTWDQNKIAGKTGGIYFSTAASFKEVKATAKKCMQNGYGGDAPENDVETLIKGLKKYPNSGEVILIADNWANIRGFEFIDQIDRPVRVIVCGGHFGINVEYLELARRTNGSIHTIDDDITNLMTLKEGETIKISGKKFTIKNGRFTKH